MVFIKVQLLLSVCFQNLVLAKGTFLPEYPSPNSTGFIFALCEYLVSCFQLENSMEEAFTTESNENTTQIKYMSKICQNLM